MTNQSMFDYSFRKQFLVLKSKNTITMFSYYEKDGEHNF